MPSGPCSASTGRSMSEPLLSVAGLTTGFDAAGRFVPAVIDVGFHLDKGETLCLVGESGSGKSLTALSIIGLVQPPGRIDRGRVVFKGRDLLRLPDREMQKIRGAEIALVFQEPMTALNPVFTIGSQIEETLRVHGRATRRTARARGDRAARSRTGAGTVEAGPRLSPPAVRRAPSARAHRDGARVQPGRPDRRRADHRAGRDDPGADPRAAARPPEAARARAAADHPRSRRRRGDGRPRGGDVRGPHRRGVRRSPISSRTRSIPTRAACSDRSPAARPGRGSWRFRGPFRVPGTLPPGCCFTPSLPFALRAMRDCASRHAPISAAAARVKCYLHGPAVEPEVRPPAPPPVTASPAVTGRA